MRPGVRLGVDVGSVRVGVATCDPAGILATPLETVQRGRGDVTRITQLVTERDAVEIVVGLPTTLRGTPGPAAAAAEAYAGELAGLVDVPVRLVDERFSTVGAQRGLHASGVDTRRGRSVIDQAAAVIILQSALDTERSSGRPPGRIVERPPWIDDPGRSTTGGTTGNDSPGAEDEAAGRPVEGER